MSDLRTKIVMDLTGNLERNARRYSGAIDRFAKDGSRSMGRLRQAADRTGKMIDSLGSRYTGMLAGAGGAYIATREAKLSAMLDKQLIQIRQTAGATGEMAEILRAELHDMSTETGQSVDSLLVGFNNLIQAGLSWEQALVTIKAISPTMAVTGAQAAVLSSALTVAAEAFDFDLSQPKLAVELLDQMTAAGRLGNAELEDLSDIFARVGVNAKAAGLNFSGTLGFIEQLSLIEKNPERLATLADSTLRLFTNQKYLKKAAKATGVKFYDAEGSRRDAFAVLGDIAEKFKTINGDLQRDKAIEKAFGEADLDTIKGLRALLSGDAIDKARKMSKEIAGSTGTIGRDLDDALDNSVDQVGRLKNALRSAADNFAQPVNDAIGNAIKYLLDEKKLGGGEIMAGTAAAATVGLLSLKGGGKLLRKFGGTAGGVAAGKALEEVAGVQPVFVTNWPGGVPFLSPKSPGPVVPKTVKEGATIAALAGGTAVTAAISLAAGAAVVSEASKAAGKALARAEAGMRTTEDLLALRSRQLVMGGGGAPGGNFQTRTIDDELAERYGGSQPGEMAGHGQPEPLRGEVVVRVEAKPGTVAGVDRLRSNRGDIDLQAETEVGMRLGGAW
jgi:TP901 family phage tail tape measure protein